jgi:hypothetical protein
MSNQTAAPLIKNQNIIIMKFTAQKIKEIGKKHNFFPNEITKIRKVKEGFVLNFKQVHTTVQVGGNGLWTSLKEVQVETEPINNGYESLGRFEVFIGKITFIKGSYAFINENYSDREGELYLCD